MTTQPPSLPSPDEYDAALQTLKFVWEKLVPRSAQPLHLPAKEGIDRILTRSRAAAARAARADTGAMVPDVDADASAGNRVPDILDAPKLTILTRIFRTLTPEERHQARILMLLRDLTDEGRRNLFFELEDSHHVDCGAEVFSDEPHECEYGHGDGDEEESGNGDDVDGEADGRTTAPAPSPVPSPVMTQGSGAPAAEEKR